ncbi:MAG: DASS family sodium-coupled anion symporter [Firmicutes bacterium]|nr:DASS family sodium-coupled anion symporter [Bacillota bacterium]
MKDNRKLWKVIAAVLISLILYFSMQNFTLEQRGVASVFILAVILWATEAFPFGITALGSMALLGLVAGIDEKMAFSGLGAPIIPMLIGSLIMAKALEFTGLSRRFALWMMTHKITAGTPGRLIATIIIITNVIALLLSTTATAAMMLPISLSFVEALNIKDKKNSFFVIKMLLALPMAANFCVATPIGTPVDLIALSDIKDATGVDISFGQWCAFGIPITIIMAIVTWFVVEFLIKKENIDTIGAMKMAKDELAAMGKIKSSEKVTIFILTIAVILWIIPDLAYHSIHNLYPDLVKWIYLKLSVNIVTVLVVLMLFVIPSKDTESGTPLNWKQAVSIEWGLILFVAGGVSLGNALFECGLAKVIGITLLNVFKMNDVWSVVAVVLALGIIFSEFTSNVAAASALLPVCIGLSSAVHINPIAPCLAMIMGIGLGVAFPFSTAPNAIIFNTGYVPQKYMLFTGTVAAIIGYFVCFGCLRIILPLVELV